MTDTQQADVNWDTGVKLIVPKAHVYAEIPETARPVSGIWAIPQTILIFLLAAIFAVMVVLIVGFVVGLVGVGSGQLTEAELQDPSGWFLGLVIVAAVIAFFGGLMLITMLKVKMEKRSLASAGLDGFLYGGRFWKGFCGGVFLALILTLPSVLVGSPTGMEAPEQLNWDHVKSTGFALFFVGIFLVVLIQASSEEVLFRGWMMSGTAARHGLFFSVLFSSVIFGLFHGDRFVAGPIWGLYAVLATGSLGVLLAGVSKASGSVLPAAGIHSGYNVTLISAAVAFVAASSEDGDLMAAFSKAFDLENLQPPELGLPFFVDVAVRVAVPVGIGLWLMGRARKT